MPTKRPSLARGAMVRAAALVALTATPAATFSVEAAARSASGSYLAARHAQGQGDFASAARYYNRALAYDPFNLELLERAVSTRVAGGQVALSFPVAARVRNIDSENRLAAVLLTARAMEAGDHADVADMIPEARGAVGAIERDLLRLWAKVGAGDPKAGALLGAVSGRFFPVHAGKMHAAMAFGVLGEHEQAEETFRQAIDANTRHKPRLYERFGEYLESHGRFTDAANLYRAAVAAYPDDALFPVLLQRAEIGDEATRPAVFTAADGAAEALFGLSAAYLADRDALNSILSLQIALWLDADLPGGRMFLAGVQERSGLRGASAENYAAVGETSPYRRMADLQRIEVLNDLERPMDALEVIDQLLERDGLDSNLLRIKGDILRYEQQYGDSAAAYDAALELIEAPAVEHWRLFYGRGVSRERLDDWDSAEGDLEQAMALQPDNAYILNYLGYTWVDRGMHLEQAQDLIRRAVSLEPNDGYIVDSLGWVLYRLGDFVGATEHLEQAVELQPTDPVINDHLGDALWRVGRRMEARFQWRRALSFSPEDDLEVDITRKLQIGLDDFDAEKAERAEVVSPNAVETAQ